MASPTDTPPTPAAQAAPLKVADIPSGAEIVFDTQEFAVTADGQLVEDVAEVNLGMTESGKGHAKIRGGGHVRGVAVVVV